MIQKISLRKAFLKTKQTFEAALTDMTVLASLLLWHQLTSNPKVNKIFARVIPFQHYMKSSSLHKRESAACMFRIPGSAHLKQEKIPQWSYA